MNMVNEKQRFHMTPVSEIKPNIAVLTSWKDIAQYVGKGVRTVQRWEKELGLPVRRPKQARKSAVLAVPSEINDWVKSQQFNSGPRDGSEKEGLLQHIRKLEEENAELKRQVQLHAKSA